ncbi:sulfatase-like hydrolase/transferase [Candidatus Desantisbacteria bacterium]|nr:sulfatase-like hydrolase/transferase [Candidatus Desantisbacteria bacterium]
MKISIRFPVHILYLIVIFLSGICIFTLFRLLLLINNLKYLNNETVKFLFYALFNRGLLFDAVITGYIILLPLLILSIDYFISMKNKIIRRITNIYLIIFFTVVFAISASDIPYFTYYNSRITRTILSWFEPESINTMWKVFFADKYYLLYLFVFLCISIFFGVYINFIYKRFLFNDDYFSYDKFYKKIAVFLSSILILLIVLRGDWKLHNKPIGTENAFFSDNAFMNQLGINPVFNFVDSFRAFRINYFNDKDAIKNVRNYLNINSGYNSPIAREVKFNEKPIKANIIIIIVESLSAAKMGSFGNPFNITPFLDDISARALSFGNIYTAGIHTYNGIFSTLFSLPALMQNKLMASTSTANQSFSGLSNNLIKHEYQTIFFCTGDKSFDNMNGFLLHNGFQRIVSDIDYPKEMIASSWGVADHNMFDYSIGELNKLYKNNKPFLSVFLTVSSHIGFKIPAVTDFKPVSKKAEDQIYEYVDWAINKFIKEAEKQTWYDNTVFVIVADHGQKFDTEYDMSLTYHHTPLIIFSPKLIKPQRNDNPGLQIDIFPTLMGILKIPYINNTLGINLNCEKRPFAFFSADDKLGCLNEKYFLIIRNNNKESLYRYKTKEVVDCIKEEPDLVNEMKRYSYSMLQTAQWLIENRKVSMQ